MTKRGSKFRGMSDGFVDSAGKFPHRSALEVAGTTLSYTKLFESASSIAATIQRLAQQANMPLTAILAHRSPSAFSGILAALLSGRGFVPLNPNFPTDRTANMLQQSGATSLIVGNEALRSLQNLLPGIVEKLLIVVPDLHDSDDLQNQFPDHTIVGADQLDSASDWKKVAVKPDDVAYLLFTSGSTGQPKGVPITHRNIRHFIDVVTQRYQVNENDRFSQMFELVFDLSIFDMFVAWESGACLCCPSREEAQIPAKYVKDSKITIWFSVPSLALHMKQLRMLRTNAFPDLRLSLFCGEALLADLVEAWALSAPNSVIENLYGPTEVTLACTAYTWDPDKSPAECVQGLVPIGRPFPGLDFLVTDDELHPVEPAGTGELLMSGPQVGPGYLHDEDKTRAAFVKLSGYKDVFYRTGDLVTMPAGSEPIRYLARLDHQIKIRGNRVELGEIEAALRDAANVETAVAIGWPITSSGANGIAAFLQKSSKDFELAGIKDKLRGSLPAHMVPKVLRVIEQLPLNPNGKVDRTALQTMLQGDSPTRQVEGLFSTAPKGEVEQDRGIVILGCPRSGTTLLRRILNAHPNIACPGETCVLSAAARFLDSEIVSDGLEFGVLNGLAFAGFEPDETLAKLRSFIFSFHAEHARAQGKGRWAEKTAVDGFHLKEIEQICDDHVQYVCMIRHGLDVACSINEFSNRGYTFLSELHKYVQKNPRPLEAFAEAWVDSTKSILEFRNRRAEDVLIVRYEDLIANPTVECQELFTFLNEDWDEEIMQDGLDKSRGLGLGDWKAHAKTTIDTESLNRWRSLPPGVVSRLAQICNPTLEACGYDQVRVQPSHDQAEARRKYKLALSVGLGQTESKQD